MSPERRAYLTQRLHELEEANETALGWGAAVGARLEEIQNIKRELRHADTKDLADFVDDYMAEGTWAKGSMRSAFITLLMRYKETT